MKESDFKHELAAAFRIIYPRAMVLRFGGSMYQVRGLPDMLIQMPRVKTGEYKHPGDPVMRETYEFPYSFWIEAKVVPATLSPNQKVLCGQLVRAGAVVLVASVFPHPEPVHHPKEIQATFTVVGPEGVNDRGGLILDRIGKNASEPRWDVSKLVDLAKTTTALQVHS